MVVREGVDAELGAHEPVTAAADDDAWQVRQAVAAALGHDTSRSAVATARRLLKDSNSQVAQQMATTLGAWRVEHSAPLLLDALESSSFGVRQRAAEALAAGWPAARQFQPKADESDRQQQLAALRQQWEVAAHDVFDEPSAAPAAVPQESISEETRQDVAARLAQLADQATTPDQREAQWAALIEIGPPLVGALEAVVEQSGRELPVEIFRRVLPDVDEQFASLAELESTEVRIRRQAAQALALQAAETPLSRLALERLVTIVTPQRDALLWQSIQRAVADDAREPAMRLHYVGLSHPTAEVRRAACEQLAAHADPQHQSALISALGDRNSDVVRAAATALAGCGPLENPLPLSRLLASREPATRLAAARALALLDYEEGDTALERLAHDADFNVRRRTAVTMGEVGRPTFTPALLSLLDDRLGVRRATLKSLAQINDVDFSKDDRGRDLPIERQAFAWRRWHEEQSQTKRATHESNKWRPERSPR